MTNPLNIYRPYDPKIVSTINQGTAVPPAPTLYSDCSQPTSIASEMDQVLAYFDINVTSPLDELLAQYTADSAVVDEEFVAEFHKKNTELLSFSAGNINLESLNSSGQTVVQQISSNTMTSQQLMDMLGLVDATDTASAEQVLRSHNVHIVNGLFLASGTLDLSCARQMVRLLSAQVQNPLKTCQATSSTSECDLLTPYLTKGAGTFTLIITHKTTLETHKENLCASPDAPASVCDAQEPTTYIETVLGVDTSINSVLANNPTLTRDDLSLYVFWNEYTYPVTHSTLKFRSYGLTDAEIAAAITTSETGNLTSCIITDPNGVLEFCCNWPDDPVIANGPDGVDPDPGPDTLISALNNAMDTPPVANADAPSYVDNHTNIPLLMLGTLDLNKTFSCRDSLGDVFGDIEDAVQAGVNAVGGMFDKATAILDSSRGVLNGVHNKITNIVSMIEQYARKFPGSVIACLFDGAGFGLSASLPREVLDALQALLDFGVVNILGLLNNLMDLLFGLLQGFCISAAFIGNLTGEALGAAGATAASGVATDIASISGMECAAIQVPWPAIIMDLLLCLMKLLNLIQRMINKAIQALRSLIATLQSLSLQFGLTLQRGLDTCSPAATLGALSAIKAQVAAFS